MFRLPLPVVIVPSPQYPLFLPLRVKPLEVSPSTLRAPGKAYLLAPSCPCRGEDALYNNDVLCLAEYGHGSHLCNRSVVAVAAAVQ